MPTPPVFVTGNPHKLAEARRVTGMKLEAFEMELPEIQSLDVGPILDAKAEAAWRQVGRPVVVEETSLELEALHGFPGPLVKWMLEAIGPEGIAQTALKLDDPRAKVVCLLRYRGQGGPPTEPGRAGFLARGECTGRLVLPARGTHGFGWDPVFQPDGHFRTFGEMSDAEKTEIGPRGRAWRRFLELYADLE
jgi:non-canonical purine NTP pyrophosphatase (RdgB/HAM1 family)